MGMGMSLIVSLVVMVIYCKLFMKAGENPIYAFVPVMNYYTLCDIVGAMWAFWAYVVALICSFMAALSGMTAIATICVLAILVINVIVYIRLLLANMDDIVWVIVLIGLELLQAFAA
ncbi:MAG: hypothetical protein E7292_00470 [Lachnospiraceae bacterium]|nr:hypothetical protein [Lachnospiraceae bacterium]